jgi:hypothetical protein
MAADHTSVKGMHENIGQDGVKSISAAAARDLLIGRWKITCAEREDYLPIIGCGGSPSLRSERDDLTSLPASAT